MLHVAAAAVACRRYQLVHERWPKRWDDLTPRFLKEIPTDAYSGEPMRLRSTDDGVLIYGLGEDRKDDGGNLDPRNRTETGFDVGVRLGGQTG